MTRNVVHAPATTNYIYNGMYRVLEFVVNYAYILSPNFSMLHGFFVCGAHIFGSNNGQPTALHIVFFSITRIIIAMFL